MDLPRLFGRDKYQINYRHIISSLVRKPGAFENYKYRDALFPTSRFRMAYDYLCDHTPAKSSKEYLKILYSAAYDGEDRVDSILSELINLDLPIEALIVESMIAVFGGEPKITTGTVKCVDLSDYDSLLTSKKGGE